VAPAPIITNLSPAFTLTINDCNPGQSPGSPPPACARPAQRGAPAHAPPRKRAGAVGRPGREGQPGCESRIFVGGVRALLVT